MVVKWKRSLVEAFTNWHLEIFFFINKRTSMFYLRLKRGGFSGKWTNGGGLGIYIPEFVPGSVVI